MKPTHKTFPTGYQKALRDHLAQGRHADLTTAREIGIQAYESKFSIANLLNRLFSRYGQYRHRSCALLKSSSSIKFKKA